MTLSTENMILEKMKKARRGTLFFTDNFLTIGNSKTVNKALERLVAKEEITRVARGIYTRPKTSKLVGEIKPTTEEIAKAIAKRDKARITPTGNYALHILGLSPQVPMNAVFLTDGAARNITIGNRSILLKKTAPKNLSTIGDISGLAIQALKTIGKDNVKDWEQNKIIDALKKEQPYKLQHDIKMAPEWIRKIMRKAI